MKIHLAQIPPEGIDLSGDTPAAILEADEFQAAGPITWRIHALFREHDLLVRGGLSVTGRLRCVRCLEPLPLTVEVPDFTAFVAKPEGECVDLTEQVREEMLLALPAYAKCDLGADGKCPVTGETHRTPDSGDASPPLGGRWSALDRLKLE